MKRLCFILFSLMVSGLSFAEFKVYTTPVVPLSQPISGHFHGELNEQLWTWGGYDYVLYPGIDSPQKEFRGYAFGASVDVPQGTVCVGGSNDGISSLSEVFLTRKVTHRESNFSQWQYDRGSRKTLPRLPKPLHNNVAAYWDGYVYTLGGQSDSVENMEVYRLQWPDGTAWDSVGTIPGEARIQAVAAVQNSASGPALYVFGGFTSLADSMRVQNNGICMNLATHEWKTLDWSKEVSGDLPTIGARSFTLGCGVIAVIGGALDQASAECFSFSGKSGNNPNNFKLQQDILLYNTYTDSWNRISGNDELARIHAGLSKVQGFWFLSGGENKPGVCSDKVTCIEVVNEKTFTLLDHIVLYLFALLFLSLSFVCRMKPDVCLNEKKHVWWIKGMSLYMASYGGFSVWFLPLSAFAYGSNLMLPYIVSATIFLLFTLLVVRKTQTADNLSSDSCAVSSSKWYKSVSLFFLFIRMILWMLLPAFVLSKATGLQWEFVVIMLGVVPLLSSLFGGKTMSITYDVLFFIIIALTSLGCICLLGINLNSAIDFHIKTDMPSMPFALICLFVLPLLSVDRTMVCRIVYNTNNSETGVRKSVLCSYVLSIIASIFFCLMGIFIYNYYKDNASVFPLYMSDISMLLPSCAIVEFPFGIAGFVIAVLFAVSWCALCRLSVAFVSCLANVNRTNAEFLNKLKNKKNYIILILVYMLLFGIAFCPRTQDFIQHVII